MILRIGFRWPGQPVTSKQIRERLSQARDQDAREQILEELREVEEMEQIARQRFQLW